MSESRIVVDRNSRRDIKMRDLYVTVDNLAEDTLLFGETLEIPLNPGEHRVKVTNRVYSKSVAFSIGQGETVRFSAANIPSRGVLSLFMVFSGTVPYKVSIERK